MTVQHLIKCSSSDRRGNCRINHSFWISEYQSCKHHHKGIQHKKKASCSDIWIFPSEKLYDNIHSAGCGMAPEHYAHPKSHKTGACHCCHQSVMCNRLILLQYICKKSDQCKRVQSGKDKFTTKFPHPK